MQPHVKIRKDYVKLVRQGKRKDAQKILEKIWGREVSEVSEVSEVLEPVTKKLKFKTLNSLSKINGIGSKTVDDIKKMFKDIPELKMALECDSVGLRDDIVSKLKEKLI